MNTYLYFLQKHYRKEKEIIIGYLSSFTNCGWDYINTGLKQSFHILLICLPYLINTF